MNSKEKIDRFREKFRLDYNDGHWYFACHAAFPVGFTVDLLYQLWANFKDQVGGTIDRLAVSDLLQSDLCRTTQRGIFEMELEVRNELLGQLRSTFGIEREQQLARFLYQYADSLQLDHLPASFRETQKLIALGTLAPNLAVEKLAQEFNQQLDAGHRPEVYRLDGLLEALLKQNEDFKNLRNFSQGVKEAFAGESLSENQLQEAFGKVIKINTSLSETAEGVRITLPENLRNKALNYRHEINQQGEVEALKRIKAARQTGAKELDLSKLGLTYLPDEIFGLSQLTSLDVFGNDLSEIPAAIIRLTQLEKLLASQNKLTSLPSSLEELKQLHTLKLDSNQLAIVPKVIFSLTQLEDLSLENNGIEFLPPEIAQLPNLRLIDLRGNPVWNIPQDRKKFTKGYLQEIWRPEGFGSPKPEVVFLVQEGEGLAMVAPIKQAHDRGELTAEIISFSSLDQLYNLCGENAANEVLLHLDFSSTAAGSLEVYLGESPLPVSMDAFHQLLAPLQNLRCLVNPQVLSKEVAKQVITENIRSLLCSPGFSRGANPQTSITSFYTLLAEGQSLAYAAGSELVAPVYEWFSSEQFAGIAGWGLPITITQKQEQQSTAETGAELDAFKRQLRDFIAKGQIKNVFNQVRIRLREGSAISDTFVMLRARYNRLEEEYLQGLVTKVNFDRENNAINVQLLLAIDSLQAEDLTPADQESPQREERKVADLEGLKNFWKELLANDLDAAFKNIRKSLKEKTEAYEEYLGIEGQFRNLNEQIINRILAHEDEVLGRNRIVESLIDWINRVESTDLTPDVLGITSHPNPMQIFLSYAEADQRMVNSLKNELAALNLVSIEIYDPAEVIAQESSLEQAEKAIEDALHESEMVLSILSPDYLNSEFCQREVQIAARRANAGESTLVPIIYQPCDWQKVPELAKRQVLPSDGEPLNMVKYLDGAIMGVARQIGSLAEQIIKEQDLKGSQRQRPEVMEMPERPRLYLAMQGPKGRRLNSQLSQIFLRRLARHAIDWEVDQNAVEAGLVTKLESYQKHLVWFHLLRDDEMSYANQSVQLSYPEEPNYSTVFEQLIKAPFLKLIILEHSVNRETVVNLLEAKIPAVMVVPEVSGGNGQLLQDFYEEMAKGNTLRTSWETVLNRQLNRGEAKRLRDFMTTPSGISKISSAVAEGIYVSDERIANWRLLPQQTETESPVDELTKQLAEALLELNFVKQKYSYTEKQGQIQHPLTIIQGSKDNAPELLLKSLLRISQVSTEVKIMELELGDNEPEWENILLNEVSRLLNISNDTATGTILETISRRLDQEDVVVVLRAFQRLNPNRRINLLEQYYDQLVQELDKVPKRLCFYLLSEQPLRDLHKVKNPNMIALSTIQPLEREDVFYWLESQSKTLPGGVLDDLRKEIGTYFLQEKSIAIRTFVELVARIAERPDLLVHLLDFLPPSPSSSYERELA